jgi:hypothetical protein
LATEKRRRVAKGTNSFFMLLSFGKTISKTARLLRELRLLRFDSEM